MSFATDDSVSLLAETRRRFDPSVQEGLTLLFSNEVKVLFDSSAPRIIRARVLEKADSGTVELVRIELTSELDLAFYLVASFSPADYAELQRKHGLRIGFDAFAKGIIDLLTRSVTTPKECQIEFRDKDGVNGNLAFVQMLRLRKVDVFVLELSPATPDVVKMHGQYRFNSLKMELQQTAQEYRTLTSRLEEKNPTLARQAKKVVETAVLKPR
jgi:hypothetical protein